jgi:hypothetical protein
MGTEPPAVRQRNDALRRARVELGLSLTDLAALLRAHGAPASCHKRLIQKWEAGETRWPQGVYRQALRAVFDRSMAELGFLDPSELDQDHVHRRTALRAAAGLAAAAALSEPYARLEFALRRAPGSLTAADGDHLIAVTDQLYEREALVTARELAPELDAHADMLAGLLQLPLTDELRRALTLCAAQTATLGGWLAHDLGRLDDARGYWSSAITAAQAAGDGPTLACVMCYQSYALAGRGDHRGAWQLLDNAAQYVRSPQHAQARAWISARQAEEAAAIGEAGPALISLERAMTAYDYADPANARPWVKFFDGSRLGSMAVNTYGLMQHPETQAAADAVMASLGAGNQKTRAVILSDVATARVKAGDLDEGCDLARRALTATIQGEAILGRQRLVALRPQLDAHADAAPVKALLPALDAAGITTTTV